MTDDGERYSSTAALRQAHTELLRRHRQEGDAPATLDAIEAFLRRARATGALVDADEDRWACQSLLDYWTATLYRSGRRPPDNVLDAFDESLAPELDDRDAPYVGLSAFDERTRRLFFGRDRVVDDLLQRVRAHPLTVVIGPSGSGKSSVVLAGLVPALKGGSSAGSEPWGVVTLLPGTGCHAAAAGSSP